MSREFAPVLICICVHLCPSVAIPAAEVAERPRHRVPDGFTIEQVVGEQQTVFPMFAAFDDRGRLFVSESSGGDLYVELTEGKKTGRIKLLEDHDGDGFFETSGLFAENLALCMGLAWRDGKLYAADPPDLVTLEDTDNDGRADKRTVILTGFGHTDNGSLHGLTFGPDGWLYMTMGHPDGYRLPRGDGTFLEGRSGALIRCRPDGSGVEAVCRGFENLVEVVFTDAGECFGTDNWFQRPENGFRDAIVHLVDGGLYPYNADAGTPQPVTGEPLGPAGRFPAAALSGMVMVRGTALGDDFRGQLFTAQHNTRAVGRHVIVPDGHTYRTQDFDFVTTDDPDFHPSDVLEDADGSLLVVDTGSWYIHHCPTGNIRHAHATGGIWRVRRADAPTSPSRLRGASPDATPWPAGEGQGASYEAGLRSADPTVVATSARALARRGRCGDDAARALTQLLSHEQPSVRMAAAEAVGRCGSADALPAVWEALAGHHAAARFYEHALIHAAHRLAGAGDLTAALDHPSPRVRMAAVILLDQPPRGGATARQVMPLLSADDEALRRTATGIVRRHPEWAGEALGQLRQWLQQPDPSPEVREALRGWVPAFQAEPAVQELVAGAVASAETANAVRVLLLEAMAAGEAAADLPPAWVEALGSVLEPQANQAGSSEVRLAAARAAAVLLAGRVEPQPLDRRLAAVADNPHEPPAVRREALRAVIGRLPTLSGPAFALLIEQLNDRASPLDRLGAAETLTRARLTGPQVVRLLAAAGDDALISPSLILPALLRANDAGALDADAARAVASYLSDSVGRGWRPAEEETTSVLPLLPDEASRQTLLARLRERGEADRQQLERYRPLLEGGDVDRGRAVFFGKSAGCSACHRVGPDGGRVGPDLTRVGAIRSGGDLLESILLPSSTFAQGYENFALRLADGTTATGVIARRTDDLLVLRDAAGAERQMPRRDVRDMKRSPVSVMPEGLERAMTEQEFRDLLAYLRSLK